MREYRLACLRLAIHEAAQVAALASMFAGILAALVLFS